MRSIAERLKSGETYIAIREKREIHLWYKGGFFWLQAGSSVISFVNADELIAHLLECVGCWQRKDGEQI